MLWFEHGLEWWRRLDSVRCFEYAKDRVLGVDTRDNRYYHVSGRERLAY
jgi:hypothetical protein